MHGAKQLIMNFEFFVNCILGTSNPFFWLSEFTANLKFQLLECDKVHNKSVREL